ncbi:unnamed protein product [Closterium sp. NIES-54]
MLQKLVKDGSLKGLEVKGTAKEIGSCPTCLETKFTKFPFSSGTGPAKAPLALVHMDVVGPTKAPSLSGSRYILTIVDDHTRAVWVYPLKTKGEVAAAVLKEWMPRAQRESGHKVKVIRTDNGGEFVGADFEAVLKKKGIQHQLMVPYNPQQNGVAERFNRTLQEGARTLLGCAGLPDPFWVTALRQVALVKNRVLATVGDKQWVPYTKWYGSAPAVNMLRAYGCMVVFHGCTNTKGTKYGRGHTVPPGSRAPAPAALAPPTPGPPTPATPAPAPLAPAAPGSIGSPDPVLTAAPPAAASTGWPAPGAPPQRCAHGTSHSHSFYEDSRGEAPAGPPDEAAPRGSAPPDSAPSDSAPPGSAPSDSAPPGSTPSGSAPPNPAPSDPAPPGSAPPDAAPPDTAPGAAPETTAT